MKSFIFCEETSYTSIRAPPCALTCFHDFSHLTQSDAVTGLYPIHLAVKNSNLNAIKALLKSNVKLDVLDQEGNTVHHYAAATNKDIVSVSEEISSKLIT